jgi:hypothetical protein
MGATVDRPRHGRQPPQTMDKLNELTTTQIALGTAGLIALIAYLVFILAPAWSSYGRVWERIAASFLSLYIGLALLGIGVAAGVGAFALYLEFASN